MRVFSHLFAPPQGVRRQGGVQPSVDRARLERLFHRTPMAWVTLSLNGLIFFLCSWRTLSPEALAFWILAMCGAGLWRLWLQGRWNDLPSGVNEMVWWEKSVAGCAALSGMLWGVLGCSVFVQASPAVQVLLGFILSGLAVGGVVNYSASRPALYGFLLPLLLPLAGSLLVNPRPTSFLLALLVVVYGLALVELGESQHRLLLGALNLKVEKQDLTKRLEENSEENTSRRAA